MVHDTLAVIIGIIILAPYILKSSHCSLFENRWSDFIYKCPISQWDTETWIHDRVPLFHIISKPNNIPPSFKRVCVIADNPMSSSVNVSRWLPAVPLRDRWRSVWHWSINPNINTDIRTHCVPRKVRFQVWILRSLSGRLAAIRCNLLIQSITMTSREG